MFKNYWLLAFGFTIVSSVAETNLPVAGIAVKSQPLKSARQVILVTTRAWDAVPGTLQRFERKNIGSPWIRVGGSFPVVVGRNGVGWGRGLHPEENMNGPRKKEGDGKSPAGIFQLSSAFGLAAPTEAKWVKLPYCQLLATVECVDDAKSSRYNSIVQRDKIINPDWTSSEKMREIGEQYRWGVTVDHNIDPVESGGGSCIFLHIWKNAQTGTSGCTAMEPKKMKSVLKWLDPARNPVLVQLPEGEFKILKGKWNLP